MTPWTDYARVLVGLALLARGAWTDARERRAERWLWQAMTLAGAVLAVVDVVRGRPDAGAYVLIGGLGGLAWTLIGRRFMAGGDWRALAGVAVLFPFQLGLGPPVWMTVTVMAGALAGAWALFRPRGGVPFLVPLFVALALRAAALA